MGLLEIDEIGRMSATGTAVLLKFDLLQSLENYIKSVYSNYPTTLYFQVVCLYKDLVKIYNLHLMQSIDQSSTAFD